MLMTNKSDHEPIRSRDRSTTTIKSASLLSTFTLQPFSLFHKQTVPYKSSEQNPNIKEVTMDSSTDPEAEYLYPEKSVIRTGKTSSGMPWTTYSTPYGEQTYTQEQEEKRKKWIENYSAPRTGVTYKNLKLGNVIFSNEEEEAFFNEAALTLPQASTSPISSFLPLPSIPPRRLCLVKRFD